MSSIPPILLRAAGALLWLSSVATAESRIGTRADRQALFDDLFAKTMEREAFSEIKNRRLGLDVAAAMRQYESEVVEAKSESGLYYALVKLSNARRDRHLRVRPVKGGLRVPTTYRPSSGGYRGLDLDGEGTPAAPVRFFADFGRAGAPQIFVGDFATGNERFEGGTKLRIGDRLTAVNGTPIARYIEAVEPYFAYSTMNGFWFKVAQTLNEKTPRLPEHLYEDALTVTLEGPSSPPYTVRLPYLPSTSIEWAGHSERRYDGFEPILQSGTFDLFRHRYGKEVLILAWKRFGRSLVADIDRLVELAKARGFLDHDLIWDGRRSGGGGRGAYAIQRLSPKPFKTTFGNLRLSDVTVPFVEAKRRQFEDRGLSDGAPETIDDGSWLMDWLEHDVMQGLRAGQAYSNNVPFKTAHAPKWSDGVLRPAEDHFRGRMVCLFGPHGGSHLDQFAAIVSDNRLCRSLGMPTGGFSNTWEWVETVHFPIGGQPVVRYMWSIGHTIRPNGEVLEGNPAEVDELIPMTAENFERYDDLLLDRALALLQDS